MHFLAIPEANERQAHPKRATFYQQHERSARRWYGEEQLDNNLQWQPECQTDFLRRTIQKTRLQKFEVSARYDSFRNLGRTGL